MSVELEKRREVWYLDTTAKWLSLGDIIETRKKKFCERKAVETLKAKQNARREAASSNIHALCSIKGSYQGEKKQKIDAVEGFLALMGPELNWPNNPVSATIVRMQLG